ncbi:DUF1232 domain-containing protein [Halopseudomonas nanhaiensis]|uniref:YkvA family protein n=1 Tax=Halopseudomonas nanhaiensis TaxID=2830842 RepID=UPI001CC14D7A|nr:YkvA family protein [Halopseudomonas nanhaiensis]UAW99875.1 DUF1232 domain-containing protein [Halopseudomonas nanhaiensis]
MSRQSFSDSQFWDKLHRYARKAGREVVERALCLYYAARRPETPTWAKTTIFGALAYFISPIDAIPDLLPFIGFSDDLTVMAAALALVSLYINDEVKRRARATTEKWFGPEIIEADR